MYHGVLSFLSYYNAVTNSFEQSFVPGAKLPYRKEAWSVYVKYTRATSRVYSFHIENLGKALILNFYISHNSNVLSYLSDNLIASKCRNKMDVFNYWLIAKTHDHMAVVLFHTQPFLNLQRQTVWFKNKLWNNQGKQSRSLANVQRYYVYLKVIFD